MEKQPEFIVVETSVLPEVFVKVLEVKKTIANKSEPSFSSACKKIGISRSAFYKYKDSVFAYDDKMTQQIVNLTVTLRDKAGVLSGLLSLLSQHEANILTLNQNIPVDGVALVSLSLNTTKGGVNPATLTKFIKQLPDVVDVRLLSGE